MNTDKKVKTEQLHFRIDKQLKDTVQALCIKNHSTLSRVVIALLKQYIKDNDINNNEIMVNIPVDKLAHARINLYALEHGTTIENLMLYSTLETIKEDNDVKY
ncbi:MAG: hypothetical protein ACLS9H_03285 [Dialister sp.]